MNVWESAALRVSFPWSDRQSNNLLDSSDCPTTITSKSQQSWSNRNAFIYNKIIRNLTPLPDILVQYQEHSGQCGEDLIVESLIVARAFSEGLDTKALYYLEIGGNQPYATSATFLLHSRLQMTGIIVEANSKLIPALRKRRPYDSNIHAAVTDRDEPTAMLSVSPLSEINSLDRNFVLGWANHTVGEDRAEELNAIRISHIIVRYMGDSAPCFVQIDVEGLDFRFLKDFDFARYRPWYIQVEPSDHYISGNSQGISRFMHSVGYHLIAKTDVNMIFGT